MKSNTTSENFKKYGKIFQIDEVHFEEFYRLLKKSTIEKSQYFLKFGEKCQYLGFVTKGTLRSFYVSENGNDKSFNYHTDNQFFTNYESILLNIPSKLNIQAIEKSEVLLLDIKDLQSLYRKEEYWQEFGRIMVEGIYLDAKKRIESLLYYSPEQRYLNLLKENPIVFQKVPQKYIASYLGITPQSLSRIRKRIGVN